MCPYDGINAHPHNLRAQTLKTLGSSIYWLIIYYVNDIFQTLLTKYAFMQVFIHIEVQNVGI